MSVSGVKQSFSRCWNNEEISPSFECPLSPSAVIQQSQNTAISEAAFGQKETVGPEALQRLLSPVLPEMRIDKLPGNKNEADPKHNALYQSTQFGQFDHRHWKHNRYRETCPR